MNDLKTFSNVEIYLQNRQVYFKREIVNSDFKTLAEAGKVHNVGNVELKRLNQSTIAFNIEINGVETIMYEYNSDLGIIDWIKRNFIPIAVFVECYQSIIKDGQL